MLGSSILVSLATVMVSAINFLSQVVLAWKFGASSSMDVYLLAISVPMFISGVLSVGMSYSLVPALVSYQPQPDSFRQLSGLLLVSFILLAAVIVGLGSWLTAGQIALLGPQLSDLQMAEAVEIARISWLTAGVMIFIAYLRGLHNAKQRFLFATFASTVPPLCVIFAGLFVSSSGGTVYIAWAMLLGSVLLVPLLLVHSHMDLNLSSTNLQAFSEAKKYISRLPLIVVAVLCFTIFQASDAFWATQLGKGNLAHLSYCQRLVVSLGNLVIAGPAAVVLTRFSRSHTAGRPQELLDDTQRVIRMVLACASPVAVYLTVFAEPTLALLFERGAFNQQTTHEVATLLPWMMLGMVPMLCVVVIFRAIFARQEVLWAAGLGILTSLIYFGLSGLLSWSLGALGIAVAYACTWWTILLLSIGVLWRGRFERLTHSDNGKFICKVAFSLSVTGVVGLACRDWTSYMEAVDIALALRLLIFGVTGAVVYVGLTFAMHIEEIRLLFFYMFRKVEAAAELMGRRRL